MKDELALNEYLAIIDPEERETASRHGLRVLHV